MNYWLMKSEPNVYSIDDLAAQPGGVDYWDGIRNYQVRNFIRDEMKKGDLAFFYHSSCAQPGIVGIVEVVREAYPDHTAFDPESKYHDPASDPANPRWFMVDVRLRRKFTAPVTLKALKANPKLAAMRVVQKGGRLSITPVAVREWNAVLAMSGA